MDESTSIWFTKCGWFQILEVGFALFLYEKNMIPYQGRLGYCLMKIVQISSTYILVYY